MIIIKQAEVYSGEHIGKRDILICAGKIELISESIPEYYSSCKVIDGTNKILTPGFIDQHVHITGGGGEGSFQTRAPEVNLSSLILGGITTVVGLLGTDGITRNVENLVAKAKALKAEGITAFVCTGSYGYPSITITGSVMKDIAFIDEVLGVKLAISDHRAPNISTEELIRLASDVRTAAMLSGKAGILVLHMGDDKSSLKQVFDALDRTSIPIKVFRPTHVNRRKELLKDAFEFAKRGGYIDLTCGTSRHKTLGECIQEAKLNQVPLENITISSDGQGSWSKYDEKGKLLKIGISEVDSLYKQFVDFVKNDGLAINEALNYVSVNVAKALELYPQKGCVAEGSDADILLFNKDLVLDSVISKGNVMMENSKLCVKCTYEQ